MLINNQLMNLLNYSPDTHAKPTRMRVCGWVVMYRAHCKPFSLYNVKIRVLHMNPYIIRKRIIT